MGATHDEGTARAQEAVQRTAGSQNTEGAADGESVAEDDGATGMEGESDEKGGLNDGMENGGLPKTIALRVGTLNVNGAKAYVREVDRRKHKEDKLGPMSFVASDKVSMVAQLMLVHELGILSLCDTHARAEDHARIQSAVTEHVPAARVHIYESIHNRVGGGDCNLGCVGVGVHTGE